MPATIPALPHVFAVSSLRSFSNSLFQNWIPSSFSGSTTSSHLMRSLEKLQSSQVLLRRMNKRTDTQTGCMAADLRQNCHELFTCSINMYLSLSLPISISIFIFTHDPQRRTRAHLLSSVPTISSLFPRESVPVAHDAAVSCVSCLCAFHPNSAFQMTSSPKLAVYNLLYLAWLKIHLTKPMCRPSEVCPSVHQERRP